MSKPVYPWRLGATSFVLPATVEENVRFLAPLVDDIQLLFFESQQRSRLPHEVDVALLAALAADHDLSYTVHLPLDLRLGCAEEKRRQQDVAEIYRLVVELGALAPLAFDLHLNEEPGLEREEWLAILERSLGELAAELGEWQQRLCLENVDYDFRPLASLVRRCGSSFCLDFGHLLRYGHGPGDIAADCKHIHLHGVIDGKDHQALRANAWLAEVVENVLTSGFCQVMTLEVYKEEMLRQSLAALAQVYTEVC